MSAELYAWIFDCRCCTVVLAAAAAADERLSVMTANRDRAIRQKVIVTNLVRALAVVPLELASRAIYACLSIAHVLAEGNHGEMCRCAIVELHVDHLIVAHVIVRLIDAAAVLSRLELQTLIEKLFAWLVFKRVDKVLNIRTIRDATFSVRKNMKKLISLKSLLLVKNLFQHFLFFWKMFLKFC